MENATREIGGSKLAIWYGKKLGKISDRYKRRSEKFIAKGNKTIVSNPACKFINPFTLLFTFTVDNTNKYQLIHQGNFKEKYKAWKEKVDLYNEKRAIYNTEIEAYEALEDKTEVETPALPEKVGDSPIDNKEMFMIILPKQKSWFLKT